MTLAIIIVNYNGGALIEAHLDRVRAEAASVPGAHIYIVDNASPDGDAERLTATAAALDDVTVIAAPKNGGFSYGNNRGFEAAQADGGYTHYLMLNPDAYPTPGCLQTLLGFMATHPEVGIVGPALIGEDGVVQRSAFLDATPRRELLGSVAAGWLYRVLGTEPVAPPARGVAHPTDWLAGAAALLSHEALTAAGPMDEAYFLYFEELDHHRAVRAAGFEIWYVPDAKAVHLVGGTTGLKDGKSEGKTNPPAYWYASRRRYFTKHFGTSGARWADVGRGLGRRWWALRHRLTGKSPAHLLDDITRMRAARATPDET